MRKIFTVLVMFILSVSGDAYSQGKVLNQVAAVVGSKMIMLSDIEDQYAQYILQGYAKDSTLKCSLLEEMMFQKLMLNQADIDSVTVTESKVENSLDDRISYYAEQMGGEDKLAKYLNQSLIEFKADMHDNMKNALIQQTMESKITENVKITPSEVKTFYNSIPADSIPTISSVMEIGQIVKIPKVSEQEKNIAKEKLSVIRERIMKGEEFSTLAVLYSEDEKSSTNSGETGLTSRGVFDPSFESAAFRLKAGEVSPLVLTRDGYHIIKLIERRGEMINVRHILIKTKASSEDLQKAKVTLDSIYTLIKAGSITFEKAAEQYSDDPSKTNGGLIVNTETGTGKFEPDQLPSGTFFTIDKLKPGELSQPVLMKTKEGRDAYRLLYLKSRTDPHPANLKEDYDYIQTAALKYKQNMTVKEWIEKKAAGTYIRIADEYKDCVFSYKWYK